MKMIIALSALVALTIAAPAPDHEKNAYIVKYSSDNTGIDGYGYGYETSNQIAHKEVGELLNAGTDNEELSVQGEYSYPGPDGVFYVVKYIANKDGFQPFGAHLPKNH